jgi:hypothetical protein
MRNNITALAFAGFVSACAPHQDTAATDNAAFQTLDEQKTLSKAANACIMGDTGYFPAFQQTMMTGPGFEDCPRIIGILHAEYERRVAENAAAWNRRVAEAEAADLAQRRAAIVQAEAH